MRKCRAIPRRHRTRCENAGDSSTAMERDRWGKVVSLRKTPCRAAVASEWDWAGLAEQSALPQREAETREWTTSGPAANPPDAGRAGQTHRNCGRAATSRRERYS